MVSSPQSPEALAHIQAEHIRLVVWEIDQLGGQLGLTEHTQAIKCWTWKSDCGLASRSEQLANFVASTVRFEQQQTSTLANDERIRQIHTLMSPSSP